MHTSSTTLYYFYKPVEKSRLLLLNRDHARACLPMVAFRFELDDHDDEGDGSSSGDDYHDHGDNSQIRLPNRARQCWSSYSASESKSDKSHTTSFHTSILHTVSTF